MLNEDLIKTIACLKEDYKPLYDSLCDLDEYLSEEEKKKETHIVLRERLLAQMVQVAAGTPKANTIHQALRALTRKHPFNKECPMELDDINFDDVDSYFALSTGHVLLRTPLFEQNLKKTHKNWSNPLTGLVFSPYDIHYIESVLDIKKPEPIKAAVLTQFGAVIIKLDNQVMIVREDGSVPYPERLLRTFWMMVALRVYPTFETLEELRDFERQARILNAAQRQVPQSQNIPVPTGSSESSQAAQQQGTGRTFLNHLFSRRRMRPNTEVDGTSPRSNNCCVIL